MKFCNKCGNQLHDEAIICPACGNAINQDTTINTSIEKPRKFSVCAILGFVFALLAGVLCLTNSIFEYSLYIGFVFSIIGLVFSSIGIGKTGKKRGKGLAFAIVGLVISIITFCITAYFVWFIMMLSSIFD
ncbi:MAG: zinc-ribbon domain-containing protein [Clostridiales bacterium]|nr:zinc-ribbon domain-containing protein [Clostridiales bacterium]